MRRRGFSEADAGLGRPTQQAPTSARDARPLIEVMQRRTGTDFRGDGSADLRDRARACASARIQRTRQLGSPPTGRPGGEQSSRARVAQPAERWPIGRVGGASTSRMGHGSNDVNGENASQGTHACASPAEQPRAFDYEGRACVRAPGRRRLPEGSAAFGGRMPDAPYPRNDLGNTDKNGATTARIHALTGTQREETRSTTWRT